MQKVRTHCPFCAFQCGILVTPGRGPDTPQIEGDPDFPVNRGKLCIKGAESARLLERSDRLLAPLMRDPDGVLCPASWESALDFVARSFEDMRRAHGANAVAVFGSGGLTNEKVYALGKFARLVLGTAHIDYNGRYCMSSAAAAQNRAFGVDRGFPFPVEDIPLADCVISWGSNWAETMPPLRQWFELQRERGGRSVVVDPRRTETAKCADLHLQPLPGSDLVLANGLLHLAIESGAVDLDYIARRTTGYDAAKHAVARYSPDYVERLSGVSERQQRQLLKWMAESPRALLMSGRGPEQHSKGVDTVHAFINLMLALGKVGKSGSGYTCLTGQGNGQGGREHGQKADQLPGYRLIENETHRSVVAAAWGVEPESLPHKGKSAYELLNSLGPSASDGPGIRGLLVMGSNVAVASPNAGNVIEGLKRLETLVVVDSFLNETAQLAHVVLPSLLWLEESGTMTNFEGRVILRREVQPPPPGPLSDLRILKELARRMGKPNALPSDDPDVVFSELAAITQGATADYSGLSHSRLATTQGVQWPCIGPQHPGTPVMFEEHFAHPDGRAKFFVVETRDAAELPDEEFPLYLTTGRVREHYNSGAQTRGIAALNSRQPEPCIEVHPACLERFDLAGEERLCLSTRRGSLLLRVKPTADIRVDTVFVPFHYGYAQSINLLTLAALDPVSRMPEFKLCAARLTKVLKS